MSPASSGFRRSGVSSVKTGNRANPTTGGAGQLYLADVAFGHPAQ